MGLINIECLFAGKRYKILRLKWERVPLSLKCSR